MIENVKNKSDLIFSKTRNMFDEVQQAFKSGEITTQRELISELFDLYEEYFDLMSEPQLKVIDFLEGDPLFSEDYNQMLYEIYQDFKTIYREVQIIAEVLKLDFQQHTVEIDMLKELGKETLDRLKDLEIYNGVQDNKNKYFARDHFLNSDKIDYDLIRSKPLLIDNGNLTLPIRSQENVASSGAEVKIALGGRSKENIAIGSESNGFPGNNTEVVSVRDDSLMERGYKAIFVGNGNNRGDYGAVLSEDDNWFEYEKVELRNKDLVNRLEKKGLNYNIDGVNQISWVEQPENGALRLNLQISLPNEQIINNIDISLYTPPQIDARPAVIKNIVIHNENGESESVVHHKIENGTSYHFSPIPAKTINIYFEQREPYLAQIGHIFYQERVATNNYGKYILEEVKKINNSGKRVAGPQINISDLGAKVEKTSQGVEVDYPYKSAVFNGAIQSIEDRIHRLSREVESEQIDVGVESIEAKRWCIGVRNIKINKIEFEDYGELVTKPFYFETPLDKISLNIEEGLSEVQNWFEYYFSIDNGVSWHPITPIEHVSNGYPKIYTIRTVESREQGIEDKPGYLEAEFDVYSVRFKIVGRKDLVEGLSDTIEMQETPILNNFKLNASLFNDLELNDDSYIYIEKPIEEIPESEEKLEMTDHASIRDKCIEEWIGESDYYITGSVSMSNPIERVEFYENKILEKSIIVYSPTDPRFVYSYSFKLDKNLYPISELGNYVMPYVIIYDTQGNKITANHDLKLIKCEEDPDESEGMTTHIQGKNENLCDRGDNYLNAIGMSQEGLREPLDRMELYMDGKLIHVEYPTKNPSYEMWMSYKLPQLTLGKQYYFKVITYDKKGALSIDRYYPYVMECFGEEGLEGDLFLSNHQICECDSLDILGSIKTRTPAKSIQYIINGKTLKESDYSKPSNGNPCMAMDDFELSSTGDNPRKQEILEQLSKKQFEDCTPCEKRRVRRLERELALIEEAEEIQRTRVYDSEFELLNKVTPQDFYESVIDKKIPGWILYDMGLRKGNDYTLEIVVEEESGKTKKETLRFSIVQCLIQNCNKIELVELKYFDMAEHKLMTSKVLAKDLPYRFYHNGAGTYMKMGWDKEKFGLYFYIAEATSFMPFVIVEVRVTYSTPYGDYVQEIPSRVISKYGELRNQDKLMAPTNANKVEEEIKNGSFENALNLTGKGTFIVYGLSSTISNNICELGDKPSDNSEVELPEKEECETQEYAVVQFYNSHHKRIETHVTPLLQTTEVYYETSKGTSKVNIGYSKMAKGLGIQLSDNPGGEPLYIISAAILQVDNGYTLYEYYQMIRQVIGDASLNKGMVTRNIELNSSIPWVENDQVIHSEAVWIRGNKTIAYYTQGMIAISELEACEKEGNFDEITEGGIISNLEFKVIEEEEEFCTYKTEKEIEDRDFDYDLSDEKEPETNKPSYPPDVKASYSFHSRKGIDYVIANIFVNDVLYDIEKFDVNQETDFTYRFPINAFNFYPGDVITIQFEVQETLSQNSKVYERKLLAKNCLEYVHDLRNHKNVDLNNGEKLCDIAKSGSFSAGFTMINGSGIISYKIMDENNNVLDHFDWDGTSSLKEKIEYSFTISDKTPRVIKRRVIFQGKDGQISDDYLTFEILDCGSLEPGGALEPEGVPGEDMGDICESGNIGEGGSGYGMKKHNHTIPEGKYRIIVNMKAYSAPDSFDMYYKGINIASSEGYMSGSKDFIVEMNVGPNDPKEISIVIFGGSGGTVWDYRVVCESLD